MPGLGHSMRLHSLDHVWNASPSSQMGTGVRASHTSFQGEVKMPPVMPLPPPPSAAAAQWAQHAYTASTQAAAAKAAAAKAAEVASAQAAAAQAAATQAQVAQVSAQQAAAAQVAQSLGYNVAPVGVPTAASYGEAPSAAAPYAQAMGPWSIAAAALAAPLLENIRLGMPGRRRAHCKDQAPCCVACGLDFLPPLPAGSLQT
eukprot:TRINITY_DN90002_c0_g1_i1.p1 TRINITY_DN90002_c0_g1~~TRINITY_DN90002_c0_g1_i1.p1  ORF type:complete len:202 (-),score=48.26 TRINITY_DN90002_c0_g1_i1:109-714(-)